MLNNDENDIGFLFFRNLKNCKISILRFFKNCKIIKILPFFINNYISIFLISIYKFIKDKDLGITDDVINDKDPKVCLSFI